MPRKLRGRTNRGKAIVTADGYIVPCDASLAGAAYEAWLRYGRGRHPVGLSFGDCFAYALAKHRAEPLLFKGEDFAKTDIVAAV